MRRYGWKNKIRPEIKLDGDKFNQKEFEKIFCCGSLRKTYKNEKMTVSYELNIKEKQNLREVLRLLAIGSRKFYLECCNNISF